MESVDEPMMIQSTPKTMIDPSPTEDTSKIRLLFVMDSLAAAGGEKSLVTLLSLLDYEKLDVSLQLFNYGGEFERYVPSQVKVLEPFSFIRRLNARRFDLPILLSRAEYVARCWRKNLKQKTKARYFWHCFSKYIPVGQEEYDVAIAYSQCLPTYYVVDKVKAKKKIGWVNCIFHLDGFEKTFNEGYYRQLNHIVLVSEAAKKHLESVYPQLREKMSVYPDIVNPYIIKRLAEEPVPSQVFNEGEGYLRILTVARLDKDDKGYDITLEACRLLRDRGLKFRWYAIGRGPFRSEMEDFIKRHELGDTFFFLGTTSNPYCYMRLADIYVQTSRHEGYGLSIAEARILNRPVVTTEFDSVYHQMVPGKNGLVVRQNPSDVANAIMQLLDDRSLYESIVAYQQQEKKGNPEAIEGFYSLLQ